ncbi:MAG TPA: arylesterase [Vicinamibacterales bacterium]|nr:arylesterase [Vicinamibacterales bacterium]
MRGTVNRFVLLALFGLALLSAGCGAAGSPSQPSGGSVIDVLGDSIGITPLPGAAYPTVLQARIAAASLPWTIRNRSVSGDTSAGGLARLDTVLADNPAIVVLELGGNDGLDGIAVNVIRSNLSEIVTRAKAHGVRVLLCGMETFSTYGPGYAADFHDIFPGLAAQFSQPLVPFVLAGVAGNPNLTLGDLIHPNVEGAKVVADNIWPYLEPMLR